MASTSAPQPTNTPGPSKAWLDVATGGWAIVIGLGIGILLGGTQFGPLVAGVIGVGIIYQLVNLVGGTKAFQSF